MSRQPPPCDLDPVEFNVHTAWWAEPNEFSSPAGWRASSHGVGGNEAALRACGCPPCLEMAEFWRQSLEFARTCGPAAMARRGPAPPEPRPPLRTAESAPVVKHVRHLLKTMTRTEVAIAAGLDKTTVTRVLRGDVRRVSLDTAEALLSVKPRLRAVS